MRGSIIIRRVNSGMKEVNNVLMFEEYWRLLQEVTSAYDGLQEVALKWGQENYHWLTE